MNKRDIQKTLQASKFDPRDPAWKEVISAGPNYCRLRAIEELRREDADLLHVIRLMVVAENA